MKIRKSLAAMATLGAGLTLATVGLTGTAHAAPSNSNYGFDGNAHIIVSGGSDTTYKAMTAIASIYNTSSIAGCTAQTSTNAGPSQNPQLNQCLSSDPAPGGTNGPVANFDRDTVVNAAPTGSGAGLASLNGFAYNAGATGTYTYQGTAKGIVDFARSSRGPSTSKGNCSTSDGTDNELSCDTFWGFAEDGVEAFGFGTHGGLNLTPNQLYLIWSCQDTTWGQITGNASDTQPIVPWGMNTSSGTFGTFNGFLNTQGGAPSGFTVDDNASTAQKPYPTGGCVRQLSTGTEPFENDVKPIFQDVVNSGGLTTGGVNDPNNWIWFGSFGLLSAFPYDSNFASNGTTYQATPDAIANAQGTFIAPGPGSIGGQTYPFDRTLYHVTAKADADCPKTSGVCNFSANPGPSVTLASGSTTPDLNVLGGTGGTSGAVREFTRFLCRSSASLDPIDPYTGINMYTEVNSAKTSSGFTPVPGSLRQSGSSCFVQS